MPSRVAWAVSARCTNGEVSRSSGLSDRLAGTYGTGGRLKPRHQGHRHRFKGTLCKLRSGHISIPGAGLRRRSRGITARALA